ncbi:MAG TPA: hypothetical protein VFH03_19240 [Actinoplanes sp.]|nr:hypothetical protein [Actinoplanes sp.]
MPGQVSQPIVGRAGQAAAPGQVSQPIPRPDDGASSGEVSGPIRGRAGPAAVPGAVAGAAAVRGTGTVPRHEPADGSASTGGTRVRSSDDLPAPAGSEPPADGWRAQLRARRRLRLVALVSLTLVVLVLLPLFVGLRAASRDPVLRSLDALDVPAWASTQVDDKSSGSQWCFLDCRFRERTAQSERAFDETNTEYVRALTAAGWQPWRVAACPEQPISDGQYSCWRRDELTLDLWVRLPQCAADAVAAQDPATLPSAGPDGAVAPAPDPAKCVGSTVSIKVQSAATDQRGQPQRAPDPSQVGETPDPVLSNDPLLDPTPTPS